MRFQVTTVLDQTPLRAQGSQRKINMLRLSCESCIGPCVECVAQDFTQAIFLALRCVRLRA